VCARADHVFNTGCKTRQVYDNVAKDIVLSTMQGINGTLFAYGQTSSGKTHTMMGEDGEPGIIPMAVDEIFDYIDTTSDMTFLLRVSCMEIYNEVRQRCGQKRARAASSAARPTFPQHIAPRRAPAPASDRG